MNATITRNGRGLAHMILRHIPSADPDHVARVCSLLCRLAPSYQRIQEAWCSDERANNHAPTRERLERREAQIERRARELVAMLPPAGKGPIAILFGGDPRGYTMRLVIPDEPHAGNTWGLGGEFGIGGGK